LRPTNSKLKNHVASLHAWILQNKPNLHLKKRGRKLGLKTAPLIRKLLQVCPDFPLFLFPETMEGRFDKVAADTHQVQGAFNTLKEAGVIPAGAVNGGADPHDLFMQVTCPGKVAGHRGII
jgi:hypothetical protein